MRRLDEGNAAPRLLALLVRVWAVAAELGIPGPAMERPAVRVPLRSRVAFLTAEQAQAFLRALEPPYREIAVVLLETGARLGEVLALMPEDIDAANRTLRIAKTWTEAPRAIGPTKSGRVRVVPFDSALGRGYTDTVTGEVTAQRGTGPPGARTEG